MDRLLGTGRETHDVGRFGAEQVIQTWKGAKEEDKPKFALAILSHANSLGKKLAELVPDEKVAEEIRKDAARA